jgi:hypothetical protein
MAGYGSRFSYAGYKTYKPFLKVSDKHDMVTNICKNFPRSTKKYFIINNLTSKKYINALYKIPNSRVIKVKHHKLGPVETILRASNNLKKLNNIFISYCDIGWKWDFKKLNFSKNYVYCFKGWHPFTKNNNNYAFCKVNKNNYLIKIKEKMSFTKKWQNEPLSIGLFYFLNFDIMIKSFKQLKSKRITTNSEYFPSESFNFIRNTKIDYVSQFVHIGNPTYLEEFKNWYSFFKKNIFFKRKIQQAKIADEYLIPAAGQGKRFKIEKIFTPKFLYYLNDLNKRTIDYINSFLPTKKKKIILQKKDKYTKFINKNKFSLFFLNKKTKGQAFTIFKILEKLNIKKSFFINSCDVFSIFNISNFLKLKRNSDIIIFVSSKSFQELGDNEYTWVEYSNKNLKNIYIKNKPNSKLKILTGNFYFKNKYVFYTCFNKALKNFKKKELYVDDLIKYALKLKFKVRVLEDENYINLGTPSLIKDFLFWRKYFSKNEL